MIDKPLSAFKEDQRIICPRYPSNDNMVNSQECCKCCYYMDVIPGRYVMWGPRCALTMFVDVNGYVSFRCY